ncbi:MAG: hypothetical protein A2Y09_09825 [Planctomycetes bacterium GWA2_39_15]|nr:MAG: hypothetical protein A2Y09_09825 [Planctomycetes bacterium GWA2_39_15]
MIKYSGVILGFLIIVLIFVFKQFFKQLIENLFKKFFDYLSEKRHIKKVFLDIIKRIRLERMANSWFYQLEQLKFLFDSNPKYLKRQENKYFYQKWLESLFCEAGVNRGHWWTISKRKDGLALLNPSLFAFSEGSDLKICLALTPSINLRHFP